MHSVLRFEVVMVAVGVRSRSGGAWTPMFCCWMRKVDALIFLKRIQQSVG